MDMGAAGVINMSGNQLLMHFNSVNGTTQLYACSSEEGALLLRSFR